MKKIAINDVWHIGIETLNWTLMKKREITNGKNIGKIRWEIKGYYRHLRDALLGYKELAEREELMMGGDVTIDETLVMLSDFTDKIVREVEGIKDICV